VAKPNRLNRYRIDRPMVSATTIPARTKCATGTVTPTTSMTSSVNTGGLSKGAVPNTSCTRDCINNRTPTEATSLARGDAVRSGRTATNSTTTASTHINTRVMTMDGAMSSAGPK
jgi:hypothetical protein